MKIVSLRPALTLVLAVAGAFGAHAQSSYVGEALNYSRLQFGGPARTLGIAGANVALGADFGNLSSNPAGLGLYQKSELHLAPGFGLGAADASGNGARLTANKNSFHISSAGAVFTTRQPDGGSGSDWRGGSLALGFTRQADFNRSLRYSNSATNANSFFQFLGEPGGYSDYTSGGYQDAVLDILDQAEKEQYTTVDGLAYANYLTDIQRVRRPGGAVGDSLLVVRIPRRDGPILQNEVVTRRGSLSQFDLGYGASYRDRLYVGGAIGIVSLNNERTSTLTEDSDGAQDFERTDNDKTTGTGVNARLGLIYRASDQLRVGASIQSPTYIRLTDTYTTTLTVHPDYVPVGLEGENSLGTVPGTYSYSITTPFRANAGVAVLLSKYGFLTGDVEYVGYSQARLSGNPNEENGDNYSFAQENEGIRQQYQSALNLRLGAEGRFDIFRLRLGYARYGDPYQYTAGGSRTQQFYTAGAGIRQRNFFLDLAGVYTTFDQQYSPYTLASGQQPVINVSNNRFTTTLTAGVTF